MRDKLICTDLFIFIAVLFCANCTFFVSRFICLLMGIVNRTELYAI